MKTALITGSAGQDGTYLTAHLKTLGYRVIGISRAPGSINLSVTEQVFHLLQESRPDEVYHLAAFQHSSQEKLIDDLDVIKQSNQVHILATANLLDGIREFCPAARFFFAASCHVYGKPATPVQTEITPFQPEGIYGITKLAGIHLCRYYRQKHGLFAAVGILYNHESPLRRSHFVSKKIVEAAVAISQHQQDHLVLGDLDAAIDWGYAGDYVAAMQQILQLAGPGEFVVASGASHQVRDFVAEAFRLVSLDWQLYVRSNPDLLRNPQRVSLIGNHEKLTQMTGWRPCVGFHELIKIMIQAELEKPSRR